MKTFLEYLRFRETDTGLMGPNVQTGDTQQTKYKDGNLKQVVSMYNSGFYKDSDPGGGGTSGGGGSGNIPALAPATGGGATPVNVTPQAGQSKKMKKMQKGGDKEYSSDGGDDNKDIWAGSGPGLGGMHPVRMKKK